MTEEEKLDLIRSLYESIVKDLDEAELRRSAHGHVPINVKYLRDGMDPDHVYMSNLIGQHQAIARHLTQIPGKYVARSLEKLLLVSLIEVAELSAALAKLQIEQEEKEVGDGHEQGT